MIKAQFRTTETGRRSFPLAYRIEFLAAWDECVEYGQKARLLREHCLSRKTVERWLDARADGRFDDTAMEAAMSQEPRRTHSQDKAALARALRENERLKAKLREAELAQEIMGKAGELLKGIDLSSPDPQTQIPPMLMSQDQFDAWLKRTRL